ncbi:SKP1-like protein 13 [Brassica napus]|nr:SKP1-like protein 13 [Brassica napus]
MSCALACKTPINTLHGLIVTSFTTFSNHSLARFFHSSFKSSHEKIATQQRRTMEMFVLKSSDDESFEVDEAVVLQSQLLSNLFEDCSGARECKIEEVTGQVLSKVVEYCKNHVVDGGGSSSSSSSSAAGEALKKWDDKFITRMDLSMVLDLIMTSNYLNIKGLFDLTCQRVADEIAACKDHKEIRAKFGIVSDYTAEEEAEVLKENE